jgi:hypothetical protein
VSDIRAALRPKQVPVFMSRRFAGESFRSREIARLIDKELRSRNFVPIEARPDPLDMNPTTVEQVEARLWASDAGIVLVLDLGQDITPLSPNLAHEYGFLHGQGKPVVFLVEKKLMRELSSSLSNIQGLVLKDFADGDDAYDPNHPQSVTARLGDWLQGVDRILRAQLNGD